MREDGLYISTLDNTLKKAQAKLKQHVGKKSLVKTLLKERRQEARKEPKIILLR